MNAFRWILRTIILATFLTTCHQHYNPRMTTKANEPLKQCFLPIPFSLSTELPERIRPLALDGFEYWNKVVGWDLFFNMGPAVFPRETMLDAGILLVRPIEGEGLNPHTSMQWMLNEKGCLDSVEIVVPVDWFKYNDGPLKTMFRHETGHALGLAHNPYPGTLMYPKIRLSTSEPAPARPESLKEIRKQYPEPEKTWQTESP